MLNQDTSKKLQVLSVFLENQTFGIPISKIQDVLRPLQLTPVPLAEKYIEGISNLRGRIVTAISLRRRIDETDEYKGESMNVVIDSHGELYSLLVDKVGDVLTIDEATIEDAPVTLSVAWRDVAHGVHQLDGGIMVVLDAEKIIHVN